MSKPLWGVVPGHGGEEQAVVALARIRRSPRSDVATGASMRLSCSAR